MPSDNPPIIPSRGRRPIMIKGLIPSLPERGKIKIGVKGKMVTSQKGNQFQPPRKLDHFVVTTLQRGGDGNFVPDDSLMRRLGDKPTEIPVRLLYDDPTLNFPTRYACFIGRTLWCAGDGEVATRLTETPKQTADGVKPEPREVECTCFRQDPAYQGHDKCKMNGALSVLIEGAGGLGGVWKFRTTSYNTILGLMSSMAFLRSVTGGILANIPLILRVQPKLATAPNDGGQVTIYIVSLEFRGDVGGLQTIAHGIALDRAKTHVAIEHIEDEARRVLALMPPANMVLPGDQADDVVEEFYPEQAATAWPTTPRADLDAFASDPGREPEREAPGPFHVIDADGEEHGFETAGAAAAAITAVFRDAARRGTAALRAAAENNTATIGHISDAGRLDLGADLRETYRELLHDAAEREKEQDADPFGLPPVRGAVASEMPDPAAEPAPYTGPFGRGGSDESAGKAGDGPNATTIASPSELGGPPEDNLFVPLAGKPPTARDYQFFVDQMLAMLNEAPRTPRRTAQIRIANERQIAALKRGAPTLYDQVQAQLALAGNTEIGR